MQNNITVVETLFLKNLAPITKWVNAELYLKIVNKALQIMLYQSVKADISCCWLIFNRIQYTNDD